MNRLKYIGLVVFLMFTFIQCTELFVPDVSSGASALVVEGLITDGSGPFTVKLTEAVPYSYDSVLDSRAVTGAKLHVTDSENNTFEFTDSGKGIYTLPPTFKSKVGNSYKLHIETKDGNIFESNAEKLLPSYTYDSIRGISDTQKYIDKNNFTRLVEGTDIRVDLFKSVTATDQSTLCRFNSDITVQYSFSYNLPDTTKWHWFVFGWEGFMLTANENITQDNSLSSTPIILNHSLGFVPIGTSNYGFSTRESASIYYYLRISQYTINKDAYSYYKDANDQLAASGKIFDPVTSQLFGNLKCLNNHSKIVLGLFEVSSVVHTAYVLDAVPFGKKPNLVKVPYVDILKSNLSRYKIWDFDPTKKPETDEYIVIPYPEWWNHY